MKVFESEIGEHPFPISERNIRVLGTLRGTIFGCNHVVSFVLFKEIQ